MVLGSGIKVSKEAKQELDKEKLYERETYNDVLLRLIRNQKEVKNGR